MSQVYVYNMSFFFFFEGEMRSKALFLLQSQKKYIYTCIKTTMRRLGTNNIADYYCSIGDDVKPYILYTRE